MTDGANTSSAAASTPAGADWIHIPTPGDHYSPRTGSALMTVIYELSRCHEAAGGRSRVMVSRGTYADNHPAGEVVEVAASRPAGRWAKRADGVCGWLGGRRGFAARAYGPAVRAIPADFRGWVLVQNAPPALYAVRRRAPGCRLLLYVQNRLFGTYGDAEVERALRPADRVICISAFLRNEIVQRVPTMADRVVTVLSGVDTDWFAPPPAGRQAGEAGPTVLFVGRVVPQKGVHLLIDAAARLRDRGHALRVHVVGSGGFAADAPLTSYETKLRERAASLGDACTFTPFQDRAALRAAYHAADVMCVPSVWEEPLGLVTAEAMACGLPVVAAWRGGIPEVGGEAALYFDPTAEVAVSQLADALRELLLDADERESRGRSCRERAETLAWPGVYRQLVQALNKGAPS